ncbi:nuclear transport factor 2 family protein [Plantactinospora sp. B5E13]|uniref:nuclear transport factor 2 family protein n=1 Tax=unclassified Plantactinospora TaxID=2631981 RepID=UPI00325EC129
MNWSNTAARRLGHGYRLVGPLVVAGVLVAGCAGSTAERTGATSASRPAGSDGPATAAPGSGPAVAGPAQAYVDAVNAGDLDALVAAFAPDGLVVDVNRRIEGRDAIRAWADAEVIGGTLRVLEVAAKPGGQDLLVHWAPGGSAGWRAHYRFTMTATTITTADLQYA